MRRRTRLIVGLSALAMAASGSLPAFAHHSTEHEGYPGCQQPPDEQTGALYESAYTIWLNSPTTAGNTTGYRSRDVYAYAAQDGNGNVTVTAFQPYWDSHGTIPGPDWVDVSATVGSGGVTYCNDSYVQGQPFPGQ